MKSEWISVKDKLPEYGKEVLLGHFSSGVKHIGWRNHTNSEGEHYWIGGCFTFKPTHWMPLPKLPGEV